MSRGEAHPRSGNGAGDEVRGASENHAKPDNGSSPENRGASENRILAIDGPAGAGKSTVAARMAARFGLLPIETGAMYRAFALHALRRGADLGDGAALGQLAGQTRLELRPAQGGGGRILVDGEDVTGALRSPEAAEAASRVSIHAPVRAWLVRLQQALGRGLPPGSPGVVMEGRDIGTVVFPEAGIKVFLEASSEARAERRLLQEGSREGGGGRSAVLAALAARDRRDRDRVESPLRRAEDAVVIDSTSLDLEQVVARVAALVQARWALPEVERTAVRRSHASPRT